MSSHVFIPRYEIIPPIIPPPRHNKRFSAKSAVPPSSPFFTIMVITSIMITYISPIKIPQINFFVFCTFPARNPPRKQESTYTTLIPMEIVPLSHPSFCTKTASKNNSNAVTAYITSKIFPRLFTLSPKNFITPHFLFAITRCFSEISLHYYGHIQNYAVHTHQFSFLFLHFAYFLGYIEIFVLATSHISRNIGYLKAIFLYIPNFRSLQ